MSKQATPTDEVGSFPRCIETLCNIQIKKCLSEGPTYSRPKVPSRVHLKRLKNVALNATFDRLKVEVDTFGGALLSGEEWNVNSSIHAVGYRMRTRYRRFHDADRLEELSEKLLEADEKYENVLKLLLHLGEPRSDPTKSRFTTSMIGVPNREEIRKLASLKGPVYDNDYPYHIYHISYKIPSMRTHRHKPDELLMYPERREDGQQGFLYAKEYTLPMKKDPRNKGSLLGIQSEVFRHKGLTGCAYEFDSQTRLYGALRHSRTSTMNVTLSYPKITGPINLVSSVTASNTLSSPDEGFVSRSSSVGFSDSDNEMSPRQPSQSGDELGLMKPYHDYRYPDYNLNVWSECLRLKRSYHRTWETLGRPAGSTKRRLYLTEAGSRIFDEIWRHRYRFVYDLANFLHGGKLPPLSLIKMEEHQLVRHATLVMMGVASETFQFNKLGQMFLPRRGVFFCGIDADAVYTLLCQFGQLGTCYWRLLHVSTPGSTQQAINDAFKFAPTHVSQDQNKGAIFKAFAGAIRRYLHEYQRQILSLDVGNQTLQRLSFKLRRAGAQIRYLCQLCNCGTPDLPHVPAEGTRDFPEGVALLSYLYEEAVHCPEPNHYLALLYLLRKSCIPYLQFVQDWVFRGKSWDTRGEFMLKVNADYGGARMDRQRWLKYVEPTNPDDPGSCVPSFLSPLAYDIYVCGKTVALMQLICPEHFLGIDGLNTPNLEVSFSKRKLQEIENKWIRHDTYMLGLEKDRTIHWMEKEEEIRASAHEVAKLVRKAAEEEIRRAQEGIQKEKEERARVKRIEFERLKKQAEEDAERRAHNVRAEKEEDKRREAEVHEQEEKIEKEKRRLLQEEKDKLVSYYDELNKAAEQRMFKATWAVRRQRHHSKRAEYLAQDKTFWENEIKNAESTLERTGASSEVAVATESPVTVKNDPKEAISSTQSSIIEDFLNATVASQNEHANPSEPDHRSELERALQSISGTDVQACINPAEASPKPHHSPGLDHVSKESEPSAEEIKPRTKPVSGKNISTSEFAPSGAFGPAALATEESRDTSRAVNGKNISDSSFAPSGAYIGSAESVTPNLQLGGKDKPGFDHTGGLNVEAALVAISGRSVEGKNVSDSHMGGIMTSSGGTESAVSAAKTAKKMVPGHSVADSSLHKDMSLPSTVTHTTKEGVSKSSMDQVFSEALPPAPMVPSSRHVEGCSVSASTVSTLLNPERNSEEAPRFVYNVESPHPAQSTVQDLLYGADGPTQDQKYVKKKVAGQDVSSSTVGDLMKLPDVISTELPSDEVDKLRRFAIQNIAHTGHHSRSTIQDLMYYEDFGPQNWEKLNTVPVSGKEVATRPKPAINHPKRHPSYSTLQLLLYPQEDAADDEGQVESTVEQSFVLQLPPMDAYSSLCDFIKAAQPEEQTNMDLQPTDLVGNVLGESLEHEFEDRVLMDSGVDWRSDIDAVEMHALPVLLARCVIKPITQQVALANRCVVNYFMTDLELPRHFEMLRHFCFMEDGEFGQILSTQLFEKIHGGSRPIEILNPVVLGSLITRAVQESAQRNSPHAQKLTFIVQDLPSVFSTNDPSSLDCFTLKYDVPWPCNIVIAEANHQKYGQVFCFLLKLKHIMWALRDVVTQLMKMGGSTRLSDSEMRQLHLYRHEMHNFVKVMQGYVSTQVVHVCWHEFQDSLKMAQCLEDLHNLHVEYLRNCVFRCLLTKKTERVMAVIMDVFKIILRFWTQISSKSVSFAQLKQTYNNFKRYAGFLFKVVEKLVDCGYQPHLEDLLVRLNFNGFYDTWNYI